tara:strand:- start:1162 stop:1380 length:219 start_codon:yes stop_codon:yes gene_type:complete
MSSKPDPVTKGSVFEAEDTEAGSQTLVPGVAPVTLGDRLAVLANAPLLPRRGQLPADHGLFDSNARNQIEMF